MFNKTVKLGIVVLLALILYIGSFTWFIHRPIQNYTMAGNDLDDYSHNWFPAAIAYDNEYTGALFVPKYMYMLYWPLHRLDWYISGNNIQDLGNGYVVVFKNPAITQYYGPFF